MLKLGGSVWAHFIFEWDHLHRYMTAAVLVQYIYEVGMAFKLVVRLFSSS